MAVINENAKFVLKNNVVGRTKQFTPINEYIFYDAELKAIQFVHETVVQIKESLAAREDIQSVSAAWLNQQGAFNGKKE